MKANEEKQAATETVKPKDIATQFSDLLQVAIEETDATARADALAKVATLSLQATERAKLEMTRRNEVTIGEDGQLVA